MNLHDVVSRLAVVVAVSGVAFAAAPANAQYYYGGCGGYGGYAGYDAYPRYYSAGYGYPYGGYRWGYRRWGW